jgi:membrane-bound serine protease (ClpP class)
MIPTIIIISLFFLVVISLAVKAQMNKPRTGLASMVGEIGHAVTKIGEEGKVFVKGEYWNAWSNEPVEKGETVEVVGAKGLKIEVKKR